MQSLRDILRSDLSKSLRALTPLDRLAAAWPIAAGHAIAQRCSVVRLQGTQAAVEVADAAWLPDLRGNTPRLVADLSRISGVPLTDILFFAAGVNPAARNGAPAWTATPANNSKASPAKLRSIPKRPARSKPTHPQDDVR